MPHWLWHQTAAVRVLPHQLFALGLLFPRGAVSLSCGLRVFFCPATFFLELLTLWRPQHGDFCSWVRCISFPSWLFRIIITSAVGASGGRASDDVMPLGTLGTLLPLPSGAPVLLQFSFPSGFQVLKAMQFGFGGSLIMSGLQIFSSWKFLFDYLF